MLAGTACLLRTGATLGSAGELKIDITVEAGAYDRVGTPVSLVLPEPLRAASKFALTQEGNNRPIAVQLESGEPPRLVWIIDNLKAGQAQHYRLSGLQGNDPQRPVVVAESNGKLLSVRIADKTMLQYNEAVVPSPIPDKPEYRRSGYLHPIFDPAGRPITGDMAPDHAHQHGVMFAYEKAQFGGRSLNFWEPSNGTISHEKTLSTTGGPVFGGFQVLLSHHENDLPDGERNVLRETWTVRVFNLKDYFLFDLASVQSCASDQPLLIDKNSYGGLAVRCHRNWLDPKNSEYLTSEGKTRENGNQTRPRWVDLAGVIDEKTSGVTVMDHPDNFRFPQPVRLHPAKPYFCFAPMAVDSFSIVPGTPFLSRYRFYVHISKPDTAKIEMLWRDYAEPPRVTERLAG
jgi:hypothetical protein